MMRDDHSPLILSALIIVLGIGPSRAGKLIRRRTDQRSSERLELHPDRGFHEGCHRVGLYFFDDLGRSFCGQVEGVPRRDVEAAHVGFRESWQLVHRREPLGGGHGERAHLARSYRLQEGGQGVEHRIHAAGDQVVHGPRRHAPIGDMRHLDARRALEQLSGEMR